MGFFHLLTEEGDVCRGPWTFRFDDCGKMLVCLAARNGNVWTCQNINSAYLREEE